MHLQHLSESHLRFFASFITPSFRRSPVHELTKLGEGTFGEAFKAGDMCFKIVPMGSEVKVNGEAQKVRFSTGIWRAVRLSFLQSESLIMQGSSQRLVCHISR